MARRKSRSAKEKVQRLIDPGPDEGGRWAPSPYALQHGRRVEVAPKDLGKELPKDSNFPKRMSNQRVIDYYKSQRHISEAEFNAANFLLSVWEQAGGSQKVSAGYDPVVVNASPTTDGIMAKRIDAAALLVSMLADIPYRSRGCVRAVVIENITASDWARRRGYRHHDSERHGLDRLRSGLQALVAIFAY